MRADSADELERLRDIETRGPAGRLWGYLGLMGPGYLQSAMTLGAGTAASALYAGAATGHALLWVAPLGMAAGAFMLGVVGDLTLESDEPMFPRLRREAGRTIAYGFALASLVASTVWHAAQYAVAAAVLADLADLAGLPGLPPLVASGLTLLAALAIVRLHGRGTRGVRVFERFQKLLVWGIVSAFAAVALKTGVKDPGTLLRGFTAFEIPAGRGATLVLSGLAAAVGINMVFLHPHNLRARGWSSAHRRLARMDLIFGTVLPYVLATSFMVIATANALHPFEGSSLGPLQAARALEPLIGLTAARLVFNLGVFAMVLSTITLHMICCGFIAGEALDLEQASPARRAFRLLPTPAFLAPLFWGRSLLWLPVVANVVCGAMLPIAYIGFIRMEFARSRRLGGARPLVRWAMIAIVIFLACAYAVNARAIWRSLA